MKQLMGLALGVVLGLGVGGCDEEDGGDDMSAEDEQAGEEEASAEDCPDGDATVPVGETRECDCPDGSKSTQQCLATGNFGGCNCGGW